MYNIQTAYKNYHPALHRGIVEDNKDPEGLGRCKVRVPSIHGELTYPIDILPWARPLALYPVHDSRGCVIIPDIGDIVWVLFEGANRDFPIYFGGTYATEDVEIDNDIVDFYIEKDDKISYNRKTHTYDIKVGEKHITVTPEGISMRGDVRIEGKLLVTDTITSNVDVYGNGTSLHNHTHGGVRSGSSSTSRPN